MVRVKFTFDKDKDSWNIWSKVNNQIKRFGKTTISKKLIEASEGKSFEDAKTSLEKLNNNLYQSNLIENFIKSLEDSWNSVEKEFFLRVDKITNKKFEGNFTAYITTIGTCPYNLNDRWFMVSLFYNLPKAMSVIGHELLHLHFHDHYFLEIEKQIGTEKTHDLREALTVLLNWEFKDLLFGFDEGYEQHKELREFISQEWKKEKDFDVLLKKCVGYLKVNNVSPIK